MGVRKKKVVVGTRIAPKVHRMMREAIKRNLHVTRAEFVRDAVLEYIQNHFSDIYSKYAGERPPDVQPQSPGA